MVWSCAAFLRSERDASTPAIAAALRAAGFNADQTHVYATLLTVPEYLLEPVESVITLEERAQGAPEAVQSWFYPGDTTGEEFVYTKHATQERSGRTDQK